MKATSTCIWRIAWAAQSSTVAMVRLRSRPPSSITVRSSRCARWTPISGELVTTVRGRSSGRICASRLVVLPASSRIAPSAGTSASCLVSDRFLLGCHQPVALGQRGLERQSLDGDGPAVHTAYDPGVSPGT